jgi:hypothetical protein
VLKLNSRYFRSICVTLVICVALVGTMSASEIVASARLRIVLNILL